MVQLVVVAVVAAGLGFGLVFTTLTGTVEPVLGWSLAVLLYGLAVVLTVVVVRLVIRTAPTRHNGSGVDHRSGRQT